MSGGLDRLRRAVVTALNEGGLPAVAALEPEARRRWDGPVAAVSLVQVRCAPGGFQDYLGVEIDVQTGAQQERYGRTAELTLALDLYAPRSGGESACQDALALAAQVLLTGGAAGLDVVELTSDRVEFLEREGLYRMGVRCRCAAWLVARRDAGGGTFEDFEVKGRMA
ncbi:MAG TPA: hypothetical protein IAC21_07185 [Candidatus Enterenecus merdae]|nr:hypothetical protein [Candidatus Enterenecus merdae]